MKISYLPSGVSEFNPIFFLNLARMAFDWRVGQPSNFGSGTIWSWEGLSRFNNTQGSGLVPVILGARCPMEESRQVSSLFHLHIKSSMVTVLYRYKQWSSATEDSFESINKYKEFAKRTELANHWKRKSSKQDQKPTKATSTTLPGATAFFTLICTLFESFQPSNSMILRMSASI